MFKIIWDKETGGVRLQSHFTSDALTVSPRPVFFEELDMLGLDKLGWQYPRCHEPLLWACNKQYFYRGVLVFDVKGANIYDNPTVIFQEGQEKLNIIPVDVDEMLKRVNNEMFLLESEAVEFIRDKFAQYSSARKTVEKAVANQMDFEALAAKQEKRTKNKMAIVKQDCDSFDVMPLEVAQEQGKKIYQTTRIDKFLASFSGGKDSQVVLDLCTRAIPPESFEVIYSDTGYELPPSLALYDQIIEFYHQKFPTLKFSVARNHESVINYWDKIGTPSDTHRWCCSIMKTAPLYRMLKIEGTNKQARILTFDGVRAEESTRRSGYNREGRGVKHDTVINARPILYWNTTEVFLYMFEHKLPINPAYRQGMTRVGCLLCPFSSEWNEHIAKLHYNDDIKPFEQRIIANAKKAGVKDVSDYIKNGGWKRRASGDLIAQNVRVSFSQTNGNFSAHIDNAHLPLETWFITVGEYTYTQEGNTGFGEIKFNKLIYKYEVEFKSKQSFTITLHNVHDGDLIGLLKRALYKAAYCVHCEVCEVECPTGALSVWPKVTIDKSKCIHCHKCLDFHEKGCIVADSLTQTNGNNKMQAQTSIDRYKNFGLRDEWVSMYLPEGDAFWTGDHGLHPTYQVPSLKNWLKDAEIIDAKAKMTELGRTLQSIFEYNTIFPWEIIWINLTYNSFIAKWFAARQKFNTPFTKSLLEEQLSTEFPTYKGKTVQNAVYQILRTLKESPIGATLGQYAEVDKSTGIRGGYNELSPEAIAYSIYKFARTKNISMLRVSDLYSPEVESGVYKEFGIAKDALEKQLRFLNSTTNRVLVAELNMGLDHITLRDDIQPIDILKMEML